MPTIINGGNADGRAEVSDRGEARVQRLLAHYEEPDEDTQIAEDKLRARR